MRKFAILFAFVLATTAVIGAISEQYKTPFEFERRYGVERVTHYDPRIGYSRIHHTVYLEPTEDSRFEGVGRGGYVPRYTRGTARVMSSDYRGYPRSEVILNTIDLKPDSEHMFEAWLVDHDTGYRLSMGTFITLKGGHAEHRYRIDLPIQAFDSIEITQEPYYDNNVLPGPVMLIGLVPETTGGTPYNPPVKQAKLLTQAYKTI